MSDDISDLVTKAARAAANQITDLVSPTASDPESGQNLSYGYLLHGYSLGVDAGVGNGHTAQLAANVDGQSWGPTQDHLPFGAGLNDPLIGKFLTIVADISVGALSSNPPPPALVTISLFQTTAQAPGKRFLLETMNVKGTFGAGNICHLDVPILLK